LVSNAIFEGIRASDTGTPAAWRPAMVQSTDPVTQAPKSTAALVLVVDDSADARALYGEYLEYCGFRVATASDGQEGIDAAHAQEPDVILMDLAMPRMNGWEAIRRLRADPLTAATPIVAISAHAFGVGPVRARDAGADVCLSKPCLPPQVARVVRAMLSSRLLSH
jgi:two-component system cell cycle response regulator DivK